MLDDQSIGILECAKGEYDADLLTQFIEQGGVDGIRLVVLRDFADLDDCRKLEQRFNQIIAADGSDRGEDGLVRNQQIGSTQFQRNGEEYVRETVKHMEHVIDLYSVLAAKTVQNLFFDDALERAFLKRGKLYRQARHLGGQGNFATTRKWLDNGAMTLHPHDDSAQVAQAAEDGFEIGAGKHTVAVNLCIADDAEGSATVMWNHRPDDAVRAKLGLEKTGYPYPIDYADQFEKVRVKIRRGDLYFMNASYLHGVENSPTNYRITAGRFITCVDHKVLTWT
ncbi:hypothetical protein RXV86_06115 [Alisedimentitalea sp. MJ-SS2]|uniref:hypothetical protein n=1 Tax=Aliisedimentitalea sp. MJ-SS2 TaxID=3049795 RepID=UPI0029108CDA|nr:hypothetical protein [Alisedimentitalea sp. MJ-SS2]MDU8926953.1 hypothetical protein [Alisedimentitalea sp. MJ-SS2]